MILMAAKQPVVREAIRAYAAEHFPDNERTGTGAALVRKQPAAPQISTGKAVESALTILQGKFSYIDIIERLDEQGTPLNVRHPRTAVGAVLHRLCQREMIREVQKGVGGKPSYYERCQTEGLDLPSTRTNTHYTIE